jgi:hypothetical protein
MTLTTRRKVPRAYDGREECSAVAQALAVASGQAPPWRTGESAQPRASDLHSTFLHSI